MFSLEGKTALITGAARGQGEAMARLFVELGSRVILGDIRDDLGEKTAALLGENSRYMHLDVRQEEHWNAAVSTACSIFGGLDILVNNAGLLQIRSFEEQTLSSFEDVVRVNLIGPFLGIRAVLDPMRRAGQGSIINISSASGLTGTAYHSAYASAKWGLRGLTKVAALELGEYGIRVNSIHPGIIDTPMVKGIAPPPGAGNHSRVPLRRIGMPQEVAPLAAFLASDAATYITGAEIAVDGGLTSGPTPPRLDGA